MEILAAADPSAVAVFRINGTTTASLSEKGEVTIRQVRKVPAAPVTNDPVLERHANPRGKLVETIEVVVKLDGADFAKIGRLVGAALTS